MRERMEHMQLLNILGPVMIGPSSSHTAGAARIGRIALRLLGEPVARAVIYFHGSFAKTGSGHGTDRAVVGGLMDMDTADERLRKSIHLAKEAGMEIEFKTINLKNAHPNSVKLELTGKSGKQIEMVAASVGGGSVEVTELNGMEISFDGTAHTLIISQHDAPGIIASVSSMMAGASVNISAMRVAREAIGKEAIMIMELDNLPAPAIISALQSMKYITGATLLEKIV